MGKVVSLTVRVAAILPDTLTLLDLVFTVDPDKVTEPVEVLDVLLDPVIVAVPNTLRVPTTVAVVHTLAVVVLEAAGERVPLTEVVDVFDAKLDFVKLAELLDDLL